MGKVGRAEAEDIGVQDGSGREPRAQYVTDDAADAGGAAAVGLNRRRVVVCLNLKAEGPAAVKINGPGVVLKDGKAPRPVEFLSGLHDGALEQVVDNPIIKSDPGLECLVDTVFRPGLGQCLQLNIGRLAPLPLEVGGDGPHFVVTKAKLLGQFGQALFIGRRKVSMF